MFGKFHEHLFKGWSRHSEVNNLVIGISHFENRIEKCTHTSSALEWANVFRCVEFHLVFTLTYFLAGFLFWFIFLILILILILICLLLVYFFYFLQIRNVTFDVFFNLLFFNFMLKVNNISFSVFCFQVITTTIANKSAVNLNGNIVTKLFSLVHSVGCQYNGRPFQSFEHFEQTSSWHWVHAGGWLV